MNDITNLKRRVRCEICFQPFDDILPSPPHICGRCIDEVAEAQMQELEAEALAAGFSCIDAYIGAQQAAQETAPLQICQHLHQARDTCDTADADSITAWQASATCSETDNPNG